MLTVEPSVPFVRFKLVTGEALTLADPRIDRMTADGVPIALYGVTGDGDGLTLAWHAVVAYVAVDGFSELEPDLSWMVA